MKFRDSIAFWRSIVLLLSLTFVPGCSEKKGSELEQSESAGTEATAQAAEPTCTAGDIAIIDMYLPPADQGATGAVFCTFANSGQEADSLIGAATPVTPTVEIHEMVEDGGMMTMRQIRGGLPIRGKGSVKMKPGGAHLMLINVDRPLQNGDTVELELRFARGGTVNCRGIVGNGPPKRGSVTTEPAEGKAGIGAEIYQNYCQTCHQSDGKGIGSIFPPLAGSDFLAEKEQTIGAIVNGLQGTITVNGKEFDGVMPPLLSVYDNDQAAAVINYVMEKFGGNAWSTTAAEVKKVRKE